jgi:serine/threonine protein kinase
MDEPIVTQNDINQLTIYVHNLAFMNDNDREKLKKIIKKLCEENEQLKIELAQRNDKTRIIEKNLLKEKNGKKRVADTFRKFRGALNPDPSGLFHGGTKLVGTNNEMYTILKIYGKGGMSLTYLAKRDSDEKKVIIKVLSPKLKDDTSHSLRFYHEADLALKLKHASLVKGLDIQFNRELRYYVMEYIEGESIGEKLAKGEIFSINTALDIVTKIANVLQYLEKQGYMHRDIKPDNIIINDHGNPIVIDIGLAKEIKAEINLTRPGTILGTIGYLPPEQCRHEVQDIRTDIFGLGATFFHMITGKSCVDISGSLQRHFQQLGEVIYDPREINSNIPLAISEIIKKMMSNKKEQRFESPRELLYKLKEIKTEKKRPN